MAYMGTLSGNEDDAANPPIPGTPENRGEPTTPDPDTRQRALQLHRQLTAAVLAERQAIREVALCLAEMDRTRGFRELGYAGLAEYGERAFGFGSGKARQLARLGRKLPELPALDRALATGVIGWTKARTVAQVATPETEDQWLAVALAQSSRELEDLAWRAHEGLPPGDPREEVEPPRYIHARFLMEMDHFELLMKALTRIQHLLGDLDVSASQLLLELAERELSRLEREGEPASDSVVRHIGSNSDLESGVARRDSVAVAPAAAAPNSPSPAEHVFQSESSGGENAYRVNYRIIAHRCPGCARTWAETRGGRFELTAESRERVECDCEIVAGDDSAGTPGHLTRSIPPATRRAVLIRDGGHCQVPGCRNHRYLDLHHLLPRARGGDHTPTNLVTVCSTHHELLHRDIVRVSRQPDGSLTWNRGLGEPLGITLALDNERAEIGHDYLSEFDGPPGSWCLIGGHEEAGETEHVFASDGEGDVWTTSGAREDAAHVFAADAEGDVWTTSGAGEDAEHVFAADAEGDVWNTSGTREETEHVFAAGQSRGPTRFPRGRTSFIIGDAYQMATRDLYRPLPPGLG